MSENTLSAQTPSKDTQSQQTEPKQTQSNRQKEDALKPIQSQVPEDKDADGNHWADKIAQLQSTLAYLEMTVDSLDATVAKQDKQLQDMQRQLQLMFTQMQTQSADSSSGQPFDAAAEVPPHY